MKNLFKIRTLLLWIICIGSYWVSAVLYPYNFYYQDSYLPGMPFPKILAMMGITLVLGTVLYVLLLGLNAIGKYIGMKKNLLLYALYHFAFCSLFAFGADKLLTVIKIEPFGLYLLLGVFPAVLYSIIYSYHVSHSKVSETKK